MFERLLIANRGEIACRVIRTARRMGISTVAVYSDADRNALHVSLADEAVHIGGSSPSASYLDQDSVIEAAKRTGATAIHPGYGFLSENASFARRCADSGICFVGPPASAIDTMGSKAAAKRIMEKAGVPLLPGYHGEEQDSALLKSEAASIGYPVLLKAVAGGGGKGMRQVFKADEFDEALEAARREAKSGFGDDAMLVEKYLLAPRHVEVQVFCDQQGNGVYLFERDCSIQRRHQKIIEEAPAPGMTEALRTAMGEAAVRAAHAVDYVGAGTVEFLLDAGGDFYFMEMNTRLQVEHPVTEMITGQDLVEWQLRVADGETLPLLQESLHIHGHAFEARIYAEDTDNGFLPAAGTITWLREPAENNHTRIDTGVIAGDEVGVFYDPMIAKLITWDEDRSRALARLHQALRSYHVLGLTTNIPFLLRVAASEPFKDARLSTDFIEHYSEILTRGDDAAPAENLAIAAIYQTLARRAEPAMSPWDTSDYWRVNQGRRHIEILVSEEAEHEVVVVEEDDHFAVTVDDTTFNIVAGLSGDQFQVELDGHQTTCTAIAGDPITLISPTQLFSFRPKLRVTTAADTVDAGGGFKAPMNGRVVDVLVAPGDQVAAGATLVILEAMKMEHAIKAPADGAVQEVFFSKDDLVEGGAPLLTFEETAPGSE